MSADNLAYFYGAVGEKYHQWRDERQLDERLSFLRTEPNLSDCFIILQGCLEWLVLPGSAQLKRHATGWKEPGEKRHQRGFRQIDCNHDGLV